MDPTDSSRAPQPDRMQALIGPAVYPAYRRVIRTLGFTLVPIVGVGVGIATIVSGAGPWHVLGAAANAAVVVAINLAFWVTIVFAVIDRRGGAPATWAVDEEPLRPERRDVSLGEVIASTVGMSLFAAFLLWQPGYQVSWASGEPSTPILDPALNTFWIPFMIAVIAANISLLVVVHVRGRWTVRTAAANTIVNAAFAGPIIWLISTEQVFSQAFVEAVSTAPVTAPTFVPTLISWIVAAIAISDTAQSWWKALRHASATRPGRVGAWTPRHP